MKRRKGEAEKGRKITDSPIRRFPDSKKAGFTILETLIALSILAVGLLGLLRALPAGLKASKLGEDMTVAILLGQRKMEEARYSPWAPSTGNGTFGPPGNNYDWDMTVTNIAPTTYLCEVSLSIYWPADLGDNSDRSKQRAVNLKTYMADY